MSRKIVDKRLKDIYRLIGLNIARLRGGMSKKVLAQKAKLSRGTITAAEKGEGINLETLIKIADALKISPADLFITDMQRNEVSYMHILLFRKLSESFGFEPKEKT
jgi:transcriptional regulator with XRE-family HTH domain